MSSEKNPYFRKHLFAKQDRLRVRDFATGKNSSTYGLCHNKEFCVFSRKCYFIKAIENFFLVFAQPDVNTRGVGRILEINMQILEFVARVSGLHRFLEFFKLLSCFYQAMQRVANTENVFYCFKPQRLKDKSNGFSLVTCYEVFIEKQHLTTIVKYANPRIRLQFAPLSRILPTPLVFISGCAKSQLQTRKTFSIALNRRVDFQKSPSSDFIWTSSLAVGRFTAKQGSLRSPRGRLVASLTVEAKRQK